MQGHTELQPKQPLNQTWSFCGVDRTEFQDLFVELQAAVTPRDTSCQESQVVSELWDTCAIYIFFGVAKLIIG